jgi:hypothetical protein
MYLWNGGYLGNDESCDCRRMSDIVTVKPSPRPSLTMSRTAVGDNVAAVCGASEEVMRPEMPRGELVVADG